MGNKAAPAAHAQGSRAYFTVRPQCDSEQVDLNPRAGRRRYMCVSKNVASRLGD